MPRSAAVRPMTEKQLQAGVEQLARTLGWKLVHHRWSIGTEPGWPDCFMVRRERCVVAELKREKGELTDVQGDWLVALSGVPSIEVHVWKPSHLDSGEILRVLR